MIRKRRYYDAHESNRAEQRSVTVHRLEVRINRIERVLVLHRTCSCLRSKRL